MLLKYKNTWDDKEVAKLIKGIMSDAKKELKLANKHFEIKNGNYQRTVRKWVFEYIIKGDCIIIINATHQQNVHESINMRQLIKEAVAKSINKFLVHEVRYIDTTYEQGDRVRKKDSSQVYNQQPIMNNEYIRVFHGTDLKTAVTIAKEGLSGKQWTPRKYSYEAGMNPVGLFVTTDFVRVDNFANPFNGGESKKASVIIEFSANSNDLDTPVWNNSVTYFAQGSFPQSFKNRKERNMQKKKYQDLARKSSKSFVSGSTNPAMADSIFNDTEHQALFIGDLNPNMIKRFWVKKYKDKGNSLVPDDKYYIPMTRAKFLKEYGNEKFSNGRNGSYKIENERVFQPTEDFTSIEDFARRILKREEEKYPKIRAYETSKEYYSFEKEVKELADNIEEDVIKYRDYQTLSRYMWPKQLRQLIGKENYDKIYDKYGIAFPDKEL
jgi:hypothetical protein